MQSDTFSFFVRDHGQTRDPILLVNGWSPGTLDRSAQLWRRSISLGRARPLLFEPHTYLCTSVPLNDGSYQWLGTTHMVVADSGIQTTLSTTGSLHYVQGNPEAVHARM